MVSIYAKENNIIRSYDIESFTSLDISKEKVIWIDILTPTDEDIAWVAQNFSIEFPEKGESEEIEISSRYWEENDEITINTYFLVYGKMATYNETVTFILKENLLISLRYLDFNAFNRCVKKLLVNPRYYKDNFTIFSEIIDIRIDNDADTLEFMAGEISKLGRESMINRDITEELLNSISYFEEMNITMRENLFDKQRILSALIRNQLINSEIRDAIRIMLKDINSLIESTKFNFERLNYLQNNYLGLINIQQNKVIKIFTIVSVIFLPPTLIASIFGMNFHHMPELDWSYGYYYSVSLMIGSALLPLYIFKKKNWL